jgi:integrase
MSSEALAQQPDWDLPIEPRRAARKSPMAPVRVSVPTVEDAITAWINAPSFAASTAIRIRDHLESRRARGWREQCGITTIEELTAERAAEYILYLRDRGAAPATLRKVKTLFSSLAGFCAEDQRYRGLEGTQLDRLRLPALVERIPEALTEAECLRVIDACGEQLRDRLIVETLMIAGLRLSELCALGLDAVHLESRPAYVHVYGSTHNPRRPKAPRERRVVIDYDASGFGRGYVPRLRHYIESVREKTYHRELFLSHRQAKRGEEPSPLTTVGVQKLLRRLEERSGVHCNPHRLRHTFATRCVDKGVPMFHLQDALGHSSLDMVRRDLLPIPPLTLS